MPGSGPHLRSGPRSLGGAAPGAMGLCPPPTSLRTRRPQPPAPVPPVSCSCFSLSPSLCPAPHLLAPLGRLVCRCLPDLISQTRVSLPGGRLSLSVTEGLLVERLLCVGRFRCSGGRDESGVRLVHPPAFASRGATSHLLHSRFPLLLAGTRGRGSGVRGSRGLAAGAAGCGARGGSRRGRPQQQRPPHAPMFHRVLSRPLWLPRSSLHTDGQAQVGGPVPKPLGLIRAGALATSSVLSGGVGLAWGSVL